MRAARPQIAFALDGSVHVSPRSCAPSAVVALDLFANGFEIVAQRFDVAQRTIELVPFEPKPRQNVVQLRELAVSDLEALDRRRILVLGAYVDAPSARIDVATTVTRATAPPRSLILRLFPLSDCGRSSSAILM